MSFAAGPPEGKFDKTALECHRKPFWNFSQHAELGLVMFGNKFVNTLSILLLIQAGHVAAWSLKTNFLECMTVANMLFDCYKIAKQSSIP